MLLLDSKFTGKTKRAAYAIFCPKLLPGNPGQFCITADLRGDSPNDVIKSRSSLGGKSGFSGDDFMN